MNQKLGLRRKSAFTLIEILVVVVILAVLAAVVVPAVLGRIKDARESAAVTDISNLKTALQNYNLDTGEYPTSEMGLDALLHNPGVPKWNKPYLDGEKVPIDPWGHPYIYVCPGNHGDFDISSAGPDGVPGNEDDIMSWNLKKQ